MAEYPMVGHYAGVGSRSTPGMVLESMQRIAGNLEQLGFVLRSGGAEGADTAFAAGVENHHRMEIFLPWNNFNGLTHNHPGVVKVPLGERQHAIERSLEYHPAPDHLGDAEKKLHGRNWFQVMGLPSFSTPASRFVVCWTPDGCEDGRKTTRATGGTGQALRIASSRQVSIPIFNLKRSDAEFRLWSFLEATLMDDGDQLPF